MSKQRLDSILEEIQHYYRKADRIVENASDGHDAYYFNYEPGHYAMVSVDTEDNAALLLADRLSYFSDVSVFDSNGSLKDIAGKIQNFLL